MRFGIGADGKPYIDTHKDIVGLEEDWLAAARHPE